MITKVQRARRLRVLHLVLEISEQEFPYNELCRQLRSRHTISICSLFPPAIEVLPDIKLFAGDGTIRSFCKNLRTAIRESQCHIIHAHTPHVAFLALFPTRGKVPTIFSVYHCYTNENLKLRNRLLELGVFRFVEGVVFCSQSSRDSYPRLYRSVLNGRSHIIHNGVDLERIDKILQHRAKVASGAQFTVTSVGRLIPIKNQVVLLDAFCRVEHSASRLVLAGGGELYSVLESVALRRGNGNVEFIGVQPRTGIFELLAQTDLFVSMSKGEGFPVAVLEAMAAGCPVILSDIPAHREIAEGVDFIPLVGPSDVQGLRNEIMRVSEMSLAERSKLGARSRRLVEKRFSLLRTVDRYEKCYYRYS